jgi:biotin carboxylase
LGVIVSRGFDKLALLLALPGWLCGETKRNLTEHRLHAGAIAQATAFCKDHGFPVLLKAAFGGGG